MRALFSSWTARAFAVGRRLTASRHLPLFLLGGWLLTAGLALDQYHTSLRREFELRALREGSGRAIAALEARAAALERVERANAQAVAAHEARRRELEREAAGLRQRLAALQQQERLRVERVATLPPLELAKRVAARLGPEADEPGLGTRDSGVGAPESVLGARQEAGGRGQSRRGNAKVSTTPPLDKLGAPLLKEEGNQVRPSPPAPLLATEGTQGRFPATPDSRLATPPLPLTDAGLRRIETAFVELEACHEQRAVEQEQLGNCREQLAAGAAIVERQGDSLAALHRALAAKDEILAKRETLHRAELRAARGSRLKRFGRALQYLGAGVVIGVVVAQ